MKCFKHSINKSPQIYADLLNIIFKKDNEEYKELTPEEKNRKAILHDLYLKAKFCPTEYNGKVIEEELQNWIEQFKVMLEENHQIGLFSMILGRLFAFSPFGEDEHKPCEAVRAMIEKYSDESLQIEYRTTIFNSRGIYSPSAGKEELKMSEDYKDNAEYFSTQGYPRTAEIYYGLHRQYLTESLREREAAENTG